MQSMPIMPHPTPVLGSNFQFPTTTTYATGNPATYLLLLVSDPRHRMNMPDASWHQREDEAGDI